MNYFRPQHQAIAAVLKQFDAAFLKRHNILFGGGTRIALELGEYRESVDIDLFCVGREAYRAARASVSSFSLGPLLIPSHDIRVVEGREIRVDRDAIRTFLSGQIQPIKLEIIHFDDVGIEADHREDLFPIPCVGIEGCFSTKLMANADRYRNHSKDIFDLCMMREHWGEIPVEAWEAACDQYSEAVIVSGLNNALVLVRDNAEKTLRQAVDSLKIDAELAARIVYELMPDWLAELGSG